MSTSSKRATLTCANLLGGKGANLAEMTKYRSACSPGLHHFHRSLHPVTMKMVEKIGEDIEKQIYEAHG